MISLGSTTRSRVRKIRTASCRRGCREEPVAEAVDHEDRGTIVPATSTAHASPHSRSPLIGRQTTPSSIVVSEFVVLSIRATSAVPTPARRSNVEEIREPLGWHPASAPAVPAVEKPS